MEHFLPFASATARLFSPSIPSYNTVMTSFLSASMLSIAILIPWLFFYKYFTPESLGKYRRTLPLFFLGGVLAAVLSFLIEGYVFDYFTLLLSPWAGISLESVPSFLLFTLVTFTFIVPIEEGSKFFVIRKLTGVRKNALSKFSDDMLLGAMAGLGFAFVENIVYLQSVLSTESGEVIVETFLLRLTAATFAHSIYGAIMGYYLGLAQFHHSYSRVFLLTGFIGSVLMHGLYNTLFLTPLNFLSVFLILVVSLILLKLIYDKKDLEENIRKFIALQGARLPWSLLRDSKEIESIISKNEIPYEAIRKSGLCPFCFHGLRGDRTVCRHCHRKIPNPS